MSTGAPANNKIRSSRAWHASTALAARCVPAAAFVLAALWIAAVDAQQADPNVDAQACQSVSENLDASIQACTRLLERQAESTARRMSVALTVRGWAWVAKGDTEKALTDFSQAIALDPALGAALEARGDLLRAGNNCAAAVADYDRAIAVQPDRLASYFGRGSCYLLTDNAAPAVADFAHIISVDPINSAGLTTRAWAMKGNAELARGDNDSAITALDAAIALDPQEPALYVNRAKVWVYIGKLDAAIGDLQRAVGADPQNVKKFAALAWRMKGEIHAARNAINVAISDYSEAIRLEPRNAAAYFERGDLFVRSGDNDRAMIDLDKAIEIDPANGATYQARGNIYRARGQYPQAIKEYDQAIEKRIGDAQIHGSRGLAQFYLAEFAKAADDFRQLADGDANAYSTLLLYISRTRAGKTAEAKVELIKAAARFKPGAWPHPVIELFLGKRTADAALSAAAKPEEKCEAQFYIGQWHLTRGARAPAAKALQAAADACPKDFVEYRGALAELSRIKQ